MLITHVAILENARAGNGQSAKQSGWLAQSLTQRNIKATIFPEKWPDDLEEFSDVWLIGGDGTLNYFINQYPDCTKPLALFKGGTGNDFAWRLYGNKSREAQLEQVLRADIKKVDIGKCNDQYFINCLGVGFDGEILNSMKSIRILGGHIGYLLAVIKKIFFFKEYTYTIQSKNEQWQEKFLLVMVVNSNRSGGGFFVAPDAAIDDGKLDMVLCKKLPIWKRLKYLPVIQKGKHLHLPYIIHRMGHSFHIQCEKELAIQIDGELRFASSLSIEVMAGKFLFRY